MWTYIQSESVPPLTAPVSLPLPLSFTHAPALSHSAHALHYCILSNKHPPPPALHPSLPLSLLSLLYICPVLSCPITYSSLLYAFTLPFALICSSLSSLSYTTTLLYSLPVLLSDMIKPFQIKSQIPLNGSKYLRTPVHAHFDIVVMKLDIICNSFISFLCSSIM